MDIEKLKKQAAELQARMARGGGGPKLDFWKAKEGANRIRILPAWTSDGPHAGDFYREVFQHWKLSEKGPVMCTKHTPHLFNADGTPVDKDCPICTLVEELRADKTNVKAQQLVRDIRAKSAFLMSIVDMEDKSYTAKDVANWKKENPEKDVPFEAGDVKVQCFAASSTIAESIINIIIANGMDITNLTEGHNVVITKVGNPDPMKTRYQVQPELKPSKVAVPENFKTPDLSRVGKVYGYDDMVKLLSESPATAKLTAGTVVATLTSNASAMGTGGEDLSAEMKRNLAS